MIKIFIATCGSALISVAVRVSLYTLRPKVQKLLTVNHPYLSRLVLFLGLLSTESNLRENKYLHFKHCDELKSIHYLMVFYSEFGLILSLY